MTHCELCGETDAPLTITEIPIPSSDPLVADDPDLVPDGHYYQMSAYTCDDCFDDVPTPPVTETTAKTWWVDVRDDYAEYNQIEEHKADMADSFEHGVDMDTTAYYDGSAQPNDPRANDTDDTFTDW